MNRTPKMNELAASPLAGKAHEMLDAGVSPRRVRQYLEENGFHVSDQFIYKYAAMRQTELLSLDEENAGELSEQDRKQRGRLLTEIQALDLIIEKGYEAIRNLEPEEITPKLLMEAIRLKNELTGGNHQFLTEYGFNSIRKLDTRRWEAVTQYMFAYIDDDKQTEVMEGIEKLERRIYRGTPFEADYDKAVPAAPPDISEREETE